MKRIIKEKKLLMKAKAAKAILFIQAAAAFLLMPATAQASSTTPPPGPINALEGTKAFTGFQQMMSDVKTLILALTGIITTVLAIIQLVGWMKAGDDEQKKRQHKSSGMGIIACGILILCVEGIVMAVFSYFQ